MSCDDCKHYCWYYDHCEQWDCDVDAREVHSCFEQQETLIRDIMVNPEWFNELKASLIIE